MDPSEHFFPFLSPDWNEKANDWIRQGGPAMGYMVLKLLEFGSHMHEALAGVWEELCAVLREIWLEGLLPAFQLVAAVFDIGLKAKGFTQGESLLIGAIFTCISMLISIPICMWAWSVFMRMWRCGLFAMGQSVMSFLRSMPPLRGIIAKEKAKLKADLLKERNAAPHAASVTQLPEKGIPTKDVLKLLAERAAHDLPIKHGESKLSGAVYISSQAHKEMLDEAYKGFSVSNPLHVDVWPSVRQMEAEVVAMTANFLGGGPETCGAMTSGGTESILMAMKASRDYMLATRGVKEPEIIMARSAHAAYWKAAEYFNLKAVVVKVGADYRLSAATVRRYMNRNTAIVVASAPGFPHGVVDHVKDIAALTKRRRVCLHVDACLGGFVLPFARQLGYEIPPFDFSVPGVTTMSVDTHKFGMAHKGTSVVLYSSPDIRKHQFTGITDWTGGLYISPGLPGSRPGALIATAWASMMHHGMDGYKKQTEEFMKVSKEFAKGVKESLHELEVMGTPEMSVVAVKAKSNKVNVYKLNDWLSKNKGWHMNALQLPPALHFCFTAAHGPKTASQLVTDMRAGLDALAADPGCVSGGSAPMYGMANVSPDRGMVSEFLVAYQDVMLAP